MVCSIAVALYSQFGPGKFPDTWWTILACVVVYVILTVTLHLFSWRHEGEAFLLTKPKAVRAGVGSERDMRKRERDEDRSPACSCSAGGRRGCALC